MAIFILAGDILHPGTVAVEADSVKQALEKASDGLFSVYDQEGKNLAFIFSGPVFDENMNEIEE